MGGLCQKPRPAPLDPSTQAPLTEIDVQTERKLDKHIAQDLVASLKEDQKIVKVLLLGSGESGKSTFIKQMKVLHLKGFKDDEKLFYRAVIYDNLFEIVKILAEASLKYDDLKFDSEENRKLADELTNTVSAYDNLRDERMVQLIKTLSADAAINGAMKRALEFKDPNINLPDSANYFLTHIERLLRPDYSPNEDDILRSRVPTTGVLQTKFIYRNTTFAMFDVGGQKCERKKWIHCFDNVTAIIFIASLSEYDQFMREDKKRNRMEDSLALFEAIVNLPWFKETAIILFFNKDDVFRQKIQTVDLHEYIPAYTGGCNYDAALNFIQNEYLKRVKNRNKRIYSHVTCATNTRNIVYVWKDVTKILISNRLMQLGLLRPNPPDSFDPDPSQSFEIAEDEPDPLDHFLV